MTFEEYILRGLKHVCSSACKYDSSGIRIGQVYFNVLAKEKEHLIKPMCEAGVDPYMTDAKLPKFLSWVQKHWED